MGSLNKWFGIGRLCNDIEMKTTSSGANVLNNTLAINENYKDKQGNKQEKTEFVKLCFWNRTAEIVNSYCRKGSQIFVEGALQTREWQDKNGNKRYTTEIKVFNLQLLDSKQDGGGQRNQGGYQQQQQQQPTSGGGHYNNNSQQDDDDIPF
jgi:single-strand DNA-binding protein